MAYDTTFSNIGGAQIYNISRPSPPDPFLTPGEIKLPRNIKDIFKLAQRFFFNDPLMGKIIRVHAHYPITDIIIKHDDPDIKKEWEYIVNNILDLRNFLICIGYDFYTYGNAFAAIIPPIRRILKCKSCQTTFDVTKVKNVKFELVQKHDKDKSKLIAHGVCPVCKRNSKMDIIDIVSNDIHDFRMTRWDPMKIDIDHNSITGKSKYYYIFSRDEIQKINNNDPDLLATAPQIFIKAIKAGYKKFRINNRFLYHFRTPTISGVHPAWGKPFYMNIMKLLYIIQQFWKTNEFIAWEHTVPLRVFYPAQGQANEAPPAGMANFIGKIDRALTRWSRDKSAILINDTPVGYQRIGGEGRAYFLIAEIKEAIDHVLIALDFPRELIFGGSWSAQFAGMRMLENSYSNYLRDLKKFLEFITTRISEFYGIPIAQLELKSFRRMDDAAYVSQIFQLAINGLISKKHAISLMGLDYNKELEEIKKEKIDEIKINEVVMKEQAASMSKVKNEYVQNMIQKLTDMVKMELSGTDIEHMDIEAVVDKLVYELLQLEDKQQIETQLQALAQRFPSLAEMVGIKLQGFFMFMESLKDIQQETEQQQLPQKTEEESTETQGKVKPLPEKKPPRRKTVPTEGE